MLEMKPHIHVEQKNTTMTKVSTPPPLVLAISLTLFLQGMIANPPILVKARMKGTLLTGQAAPQ